VPLLFDDGTSIASNPSIRHLASALFPPAGTTVSGRPVLNLSLAVNYAASGTDVRSYHAVNLAIHVLAGLAAFGIVRRTLVPRMGDAARTLGFAAALLWTLHPLVTEAVTYTVQRAESLMGLFYLLTLYSFIRGAEAVGARQKLWFAAAVAACLLGMGTKEVMVSAPLVVLLYDRTFLAGGFGAALRRRRWLYAALAATWLALAPLVAGAHGRGGSAGFGTGVAWWSYCLVQLRAIVLYLRLSLWPSPLVFDYGSRLEPEPLATAACALLVCLLVAAAAWALVRAPAVGFLGACFFALLAPSSSVVPVATEAMAEHRMYLALIPVVVLVVTAVHRWTGRAAVPILSALAVALACATFERNATYRTEEAIWRDTVLKRPGNERAQDNLGFVLSRLPGRSDEAIAHYEEALRLKPDFVEAHYNLAYALLAKPGRLGDAISHYEAAIRLRPDLAEVHFNLARALEAVPGRSGEAVAQYEEAVRLKPDYAEAHYNLGFMLQSMPGRLADAAAQFEETLRLRPDNAGAHFSLACALQGLPGRLGESVHQYEEAIRLKPDYVAARCNLGNALNALGRVPEAVAQYEEAVRLMPADSTIRMNFAVVLLNAPGRRADAVENLREAVRLDPGNRAARGILSRLGAAGP
jgi:tetratricopeptide (TPR) repeat protein